MEKHTLGRTGLEASVAGLGSGGFSRLGMFSEGIDHAGRIIRQAYEEGVNFFDTATRYGTEPALGKALQGIARDNYILSTKFPHSDNGKLKPAEALEQSVDESLKELKTDYIDIYHLHGVLPQLYPLARDRFYPELLKMKEKGKIRFTGLTELFGTDSSHEALKLALQDDLWDVVMLGYNIINPSAAKTVLPLTQAKNVGTLCMFAVRNSLSKPEELKIDVQKMIAAHQVDQSLVKEEHTLDFLIDSGYSKTIMEAAYRFCRHTAGIDVTLTGTGNPQHLAENIKSIQMPPLPREALDRLEAMFGRVDCVSGEQEMPHI